MNFKLPSTYLYDSDRPHFFEASRSRIMGLSSRVGNTLLSLLDCSDSSHGAELSEVSSLRTL